MAAHGKSGLFFVSSDFSNFQYVNEMYGYEVGDRILHDFAIALQEKCQNGVLFCRVTSDHFVGVLKEDTVEKAIWNSPILLCRRPTAATTSAIWSLPRECMKSWRMTGRCPP